jgi:hypothetical protein
MPKALFIMIASGKSTTKLNMWTLAQKLITFKKAKNN